MPGAFELFLAYRFIKLLSSNFTEWDAYKEGIIDKEGNKIKNPSTAAEKAAWTKFEVVARNIKKLIMRFVPFGKTKLGGAAAAAFLLKENLSDDAFEAIQDGLMEYLKETGAYDFIVLEMSLQEGSDTLSKGTYQLTDPSFWDLKKGQDLFILTKDVKPDEHVLGIPLYTVKVHQANKKITVSKDIIRKVK